jgi:MFS family permease
VAGPQFPPEQEDIGGEAVRPGRLGILRRLAVDLTPLRRSPAYRRLWIGQGISAIGNQITTVAIPFQLYQLTHSTLMVGLLAGVALVPLLTMTLLGGAVADAVDRRRLLICTDLALIATSTTLLVNATLAHPRVWVLFVAEVAGTTAYGFFRPALDAMTPRLVGVDMIAQASALESIYSSLAHVAGPAGGGVLIAVIGLPGAFAVDIATFAASLTSVFLLPPMPPVHEVDRPGVRSIVEGFRYVRGRPALTGIFVADTNAMIFGMPIALFPAYADHFGGGAQTVGFLYAAPWAGALIGSLSSGWIGHVRRQGVALVLAVVAWGVAVGVAGLAPSLWLMVALLAVGGAADLVSAVYRQSILQTYAPDRLRGRLQGVFTVVVAGGPRLGDLRAGGTASITGATASWAGGGFVAAALAIVLASVFPPLLRYQPPEEPSGTG